MRRLSLVLFFAALAASCSHEDRNLARMDTHKGEKPDAVVVTPPNGYPRAMSTVAAERSRVGMLPMKQTVREAKVVPVKTEQVVRNETVRDTTVTRSAAPRMHHRSKMRAHVGGTGRASHHASGMVGSKSPAYIQHMTETEALNRLHHVNQMEIALADLAERHAKSESMLAAARQNRAEQAKRAEEIQALASKRKLMLETFQPATFETAVSKELSALKGAEFEAAYTMALERSRRDANYDLAVASRDVRDAEISRYIRNYKPSLTAHARNRATYERARAGDADLGR